MYKYDITRSIDDLDKSLSYVVNKVFKYNTDHIIIDNVLVFTANVIIDLCHERDNYYQYPLHLHVCRTEGFKKTCMHIMITTV